MRSTTTDALGGQQRRGFWLRTLHQWHWISSAVCLVGMLLFAITGITLNHASQIEAEPQVVNRTLTLPAPLLAALGKRAEGNAPLPGTRRGLACTTNFDTSIGAREAEWSAEEIYLSLPGPGARCLAQHRSRRAARSNTSAPTAAGSPTSTICTKAATRAPAWSWFIDVFAVACLVFCITGLFLLQMHARQRRMTWPYVGLGLVMPVLLALLFIH